MLRSNIAGLRHDLQRKGIPHQMKRHLVCAAVSILLFTVTVANASDCAYARNDTDLFTKEVLRTTQWERMTTETNKKQEHPDGFVSAIIVGGQQFLAIKILIYEDPQRLPPKLSDEFLYNIFVAESGSKLLLRLADASILELNTARLVRGTSTLTDIGKRPNRHDNQTTAVLRFPLGADDIMTLSNHSATNIRLTVAGRHYDFNLRHEVYDGIKRAVGCLNPTQSADADT